MGLGQMAQVVKVKRVISRGFSQWVYCCCFSSFTTVSGAFCDVKCNVMLWIQITDELSCLLEWQWGQEVIFLCVDPHLKNLYRPANFGGIISTSFPGNLQEVLLRTLCYFLLIRWKLEMMSNWYDWNEFIPINRVTKRGALKCKNIINHHQDK